MLLSTIASVFSTFLFAQGAHAALTPHQVATNINIVTTVSTNTKSTLMGLSTDTSPSQVRIISQTLASNLNTIINDLSRDVLAMQATPPFSDGMSQPVVDALRKFVSIHQALLTVVIGKHGIFAQFYLTVPIAVVLSSLEVMIDKFAIAMIDMIPTRENDVLADKLALDGSVHECKTIYRQFCVSNLFYPKYMPTCLAL